MEKRESEKERDECSIIREVEVEHINLKFGKKIMYCKEKRRGH